MVKVQLLLDLVASARAKIDVSEVRFWRGCLARRLQVSGECPMIRNSEMERRHNPKHINHAF